MWSLDDRDLSASGIEQYLHCPYHFFVQRILGFSTDEFADTVDTIAPNDMGTLLHSAFEHFVEQSRATGTLPDAGQPWPTSAIGDLRRMVDAEEYFGKAIKVNPRSRESYVKLAYVKNTLGKVHLCGG